MNVNKISIYSQIFLSMTKRGGWLSKDEESEYRLGTDPEFMKDLNEVPKELHDMYSNEEWYNGVDSVYSPEGFGRISFKILAKPGYYPDVQNPFKGFHVFVENQMDGSIPVKDQRDFTERFMYENSTLPNEEETRLLIDMLESQTTPGSIKNRAYVILKNMGVELKPVKDYYI